MRWIAGVPAGSQAWLLESARVLRQVEQELARALEVEGFQEVILPVLDFGEGAAHLRSPHERAELLRFFDAGGELLALRSDFTPQLARLLSPHLPSLQLPLQLFYRGEVYRRPDPQGVRDSQVFQVGAERLVAKESLEQPEVHMLRICTALLDQLQIGVFHMVLGLAGAFDEWGDLRSREADFELVTRALVRRERRQLKELAPELLPIVDQGIPRDKAVLGPKTAERLTSLELFVRELCVCFPKVSWRMDLAEFADCSPRLGNQRGRELRSYYDGVVFRAYVPERSAPVANGGRYDRLFDAMGTPVAAAGFALRSDWVAELRMRSGGVG